MANVLILGASGMLGRALVGHFASCPHHRVTASLRPSRRIQEFKADYPGLDWTHLDTETASTADLAALLSGFEWVINAVGLIKQKIHAGSLQDWEKALRVNALFSVLLARAAEQTGSTVLQITTDCVFSGVRGGYDENDPHDALDVYGKSKSLGEIESPHIRHLRCSIVGPEQETSYSLLNWFLSHPRGATISGYLNHHWNGLTAFSFAKICQGIIDTGIELPVHQHVVPADSVSKYALLRLFGQHFGRDDIEIRPIDAVESVDRTLSTIDPDRNFRLWVAAGYAHPPTISHMIQELAAHAAIRE